MQKGFTTILAIVIGGLILLGGGYIALNKITQEPEIDNLGLRTFTVPQGGTGAVSFTAGELLVGNGTSAITTISSSGVGLPFAWTDQGWGVSTSTTIGLLNGFLSTASSTIVGNLRVDGNATTTGTLSVGDSIIPNMTLSGTNLTLNKLYDYTISPGRITGGGITLNDGQTFSIAAGTGFIRATDNDTAPLKYFNWTATSTIDTATNTAEYIGVDYNSGSPIVITQSTNVWNLDTQFPLGSVINEAGILYSNSNSWWVGDGLTNVIERFQADGYVIRDGYVGGLIIGVTGTRNPTLTGGTLWSRLNEFDITDKDCSATDIFYAWWRDGAGGWVRGNAASSTYIVTSYDNNSGSVVNMNNNYYANYWVWTTIDNNGQLMLIYPQNQYPTLSQALDEGVPTFPTEWYEHGILLGRITFKQGTDAPEQVGSIFTTNFTSSTVNDHNDLAGLQGGTTAEYYHLTSSEHTELNGWLDDAILATDGGLTVNSATTTDSIVVGGYLTVAGNATTTGHLAALGGNSDQWNTAFGWGNHADASYLTSPIWTAIENGIYHNTTTDTVLIGKNTVADASRALEVSGEIYGTGDINASTNGTSLASPRVFGYKDLSSGEAARFQFGDEHNGLQNAYASDVGLYSYWGLVLMGGRQNYNTNFAAPGFQKTMNVGVLVKSDTAGAGNDPGSNANPVTTFGIQATTTQWANLTEWMDSTGAALSIVDSNGYFAINNTATTTYPLYVNGDSYFNGNATTTGSHYIGNFCMSDGCRDTIAGIAGSADWDTLTNKPATSSILALIDSDYRIAKLFATTTLMQSATVTESFYSSGISVFGGNMTLINATSSGSLVVVDLTATGDIILPNDSITDAMIDWDNLTDLAAGGVVTWSNLASGELTSEVLIIGTDVKAGTLTDTKYCTWDDGNSQVVCNSEGSTGLTDINSSQLGQLSDVNTTTVAAWDILVWDGDSWENQATTTLILDYELDTFAELNTLVADKTLVNEEDAATWDAIQTFSVDVRALGGLHATTTDFDLLMVNGNATSTGHMAAVEFIQNGTSLVNLYSPLVGGASIVTVGTLTSGSTGAGFTVDLDASTLTCTNCLGTDEIDETATFEFSALSNATSTGSLVVVDLTATGDIILPNDSITDAMIDWDNLTDLAGGGVVTWSNLASGELTSEVLILGTDVKAGTLTDTKYCIWDDGNSQIVCNSDDSAGLTDINSSQLGQLTDVNTTTLAVGSALMYSGTEWLSYATTTMLMDYELDTFAELNALVADKTLVNEEDVVTWDSLITFGAGFISNASSTATSDFKVGGLFQASSTALFSIFSALSGTTTQSFYVGLDRVYGARDKSLILATSTLNYISASTATSTIPLDFSSKAKTITSLYCITNDNTATVRITDGTNAITANSIEYLNCTSSGNSYTIDGANTFTAREKTQIEVGNRSMTQWVNVILTEKYD